MIYEPTTTDNQFSPKNHFQQLQQLARFQQQPELRKHASTSSMRSKRRFSDDEEVCKKNRFQPSTPQHQQQQEYPKFHHPDGGFIQFTPNGTIRTILKDNVEISELIDTNNSQDTKFNFKNINHGIDGYKLNSFSPTPSVESYMQKGYANNNNTNYLDFYSYDCDSDLDDDEDDFEMN